MATLALKFASAVLPFVAKAISPHIFPENELPHPPSLEAIGATIGEVVGGKLSNSNYAVYKNAKQHFEDFQSYLESRKRKHGQIVPSQFVDRNKGPYADALRRLSQSFDELQKSILYMAQDRESAARTDREVFKHLELTCNMHTLSILIAAIFHQIDLFATGEPTIWEQNVNSATEQAQNDLVAWGRTWQQRRFDWVRVVQDGGPGLLGIGNWSLTIVDDGLESDCLAPPLQKKQFGAFFPNNPFYERALAQYPSDPTVESNLVALPKFEGWEFAVDIAPGILSGHPRGYKSEGSRKWRSKWEDGFWAVWKVPFDLAQTEAERCATVYRLRLFANALQLAQKWGEITIVWKRMRETALMTTPTKITDTGHKSQAYTNASEPQPVTGKQFASQVPLYKPEMRSPTGMAKIDPAGADQINAESVAAFALSVDILAEMIPATGLQSPFTVEEGLAATQKLTEQAEPARSNKESDKANA